MLVANLYSLRGGFVSVCGGLFFGMRWGLGGGGGIVEVHFGKGHPVCWGGPAGRDAAVAGV